MTTSQRIAAALLALLVVPAGVAPAAAAGTKTETTSESSPAEAGSTDPEEMSDDEILDETAEVDQQIEQHDEAYENSTDARERQAHRKESSRLGKRRAALKTAWRNNDGEKGTERSDEDFEDALEKRIANGEPMPFDPRNLPKD